MRSRRALPRRLATLVVAVALPTVVAASAYAGAGAASAIRTVNVDDNFFSPVTVAVAQGDTVRWRFVGAFAHTVTDTTGMGIYDSGVRQTGTFDHRFAAAGSYGYVCQIHFGMNGRVNVPVRAIPLTGTPQTVFTIRWSSSAAPTGFRHDVQIRRPGSTAFVAWRTGIVAGSATFKADRGRGTYQFRSRLRKLAGGASAFSAARAITVS